MKTKTHLDFVYQDGGISMHVRVTEFLSDRPGFLPKITVSYSNSMREQAFHVDPHQFLDIAMRSATDKRREMYQDIATLLSGMQS